MELATELETERHRRLQAVRSQQQMDGSEGDPDENPPIFQEPPATLSKEAGEEKSRLEVTCQTGNVIGGERSVCVHCRT